MARQSCPVHGGQAGCRQLDQLSTSPPPFACYLLQVLAAIEACYGFHMHTAYLCTHHNVVADALTRKNADEVIKEASLGALPKPDEALRSFLDRGWKRRALVWAGQADADTTQPFKLAEYRRPIGPLKAIASSSVLKVRFVHLGKLAEGYVSLLLSSGAQQVEGTEGGPRRDRARVNPFWPA